MRLEARSPQRASVVMPCNVLVEEPAPVHFLDTTVYPELRLDVRERAFQCVVGVGYSELRIVICRPQVGHVALQALLSGLWVKCVFPDGSVLRSERKACICITSGHYGDHILPPHLNHRKSIFASY